MSNRSWRQHVTLTLASPDPAERPLRVAVVGVGQELHGDDAAGLAVVQALRRRLGDRDDVLLIEAGPSPENVTGALRRFGPSVVLLVDAAVMGEPPGTVRCMDPRVSDGISASTHTLPLALVADFLTRELACEVRLLGIQPAATDFPSRVSAPVRLGIRRSVSGLAGLLAGALPDRT